MSVVIALAVVGLFGVSVGFSFGAIVVWRALKRRGVRLILPVGRYSGDDQSDDDIINQAAAEWARAHGQPEAAPLVARKLRLLQGIAERRSRGWSS